MCTTVPSASSAAQEKPAQNSIKTGGPLHIVFSCFFMHICSFMLLEVSILMLTLLDSRNYNRYEPLNYD